MNHHTAEYNGKQVIVEDVNNKTEFRRACMRIIDNATNGIVTTPKGLRYEITRERRTARLI